MDPVLTITLCWIITECKKKNRVCNPKHYIAIHVKSQFHFAQMSTEKIFPFLSILNASDFVIYLLPKNGASLFYTFFAVT